MTLSTEKSHLTHINEGIDFLGQNVRKYNGKLLIKPSPKSLKAVLAKIRTIIKDNRQTTTGQLIKQLNPIIKGWARYHRHIVSKQTFSKVDNALFISLWGWAKRRHSNKSKRG